MSGSFSAATNAPPCDAPNGRYRPSGAASCAPVAPENTFTWAAIPGPLPTTMSGTPSSSTYARATRAPPVNPDPNGRKSASTAPVAPANTRTRAGAPAPVPATSSDTLP